MMEGEHSNVCVCVHHKKKGIFLVVFGLLFLGGNLGWWGGQIVNIGWPILLLLAGASSLMKCKCC